MVGKKEGILRVLLKTRPAHEGKSETRKHPNEHKEVLEEKRAVLIKRFKRGCRVGKKLVQHIGKKKSASQNSGKKV